MLAEQHVRAGMGMSWEQQSTCTMRTCAAIRLRAPSAPPSGAMSTECSLLADGRRRTRRVTCGRDASRRASGGCAWSVWTTCRRLGQARTLLTPARDVDTAARALGTGVVGRNSDSPLEGGAPQRRTKKQIAWVRPSWPLSPCPRYDARRHVAVCMRNQHECMKLK